MKCEKILKKMLIAVVPLLLYKYSSKQNALGEKWTVATGDAIMLFANLKFDKRKTKQNVFRFKCIGCRYNVELIIIN